MTAADSSHAHSQPGWYHGPKGWIISTLLGVVIGVVLSLVLPPSPAADVAHEHAAHEEMVVVQISPDGERVRRLPDGTTVKEGSSDSPAPASEDSLNAEHHAGGRGGPGVELWMVAPFALLLASVALMPFVSPRFWHAHYVDVALFLGGLVTAYYIRAFGGLSDGWGGHGVHAMLHAGIEYYSFIALVGGLYVVSGGVFLNIRARGTPLNNTLLLAFGALIANVVGTTGASMLLIRPFMRMNAGRLHAMHVVLFIFIVSNCGGCLTPIGDPPLYLGFLKGVPFEWTALRLWPMWAMCVGLLLVIFFAIDTRLGPSTLAEELVRKDRALHLEKKGLIHGWFSVGMLALLVGAVFIDPIIKSAGFFGSSLAGIPVGASVQIVIAVVACMCTPQWIHAANGFTFAPVKEVGFLFAGIFATMVPALEYLAANGSKLGLETPTQFYFGTGLLSGVLDNAPTYLNFMQTAFAVLHVPLTDEGVREFLASTYEVTHADGTPVHYHGERLLAAISLGAVFFGAMTYIGNGPNFMVKAIAEAGGVKMPSFFGYLVLALLILIPVLVGVWAVFIVG